MSKIICDICGTRFPDTTEQCPICGHIRSADEKPIEDVLITDSVPHETRQKVRGGRFSKSNVQKRTQNSHSYEEVFEEERPVRRDKPVREPKPVKDEKRVKETKPAKKAAAAKAVQKDEDIFAEDTQNKKANTVLNILLVIVILALLAVTAYIFTQHVLPNMNKPEPTVAPTAATVPTEPPPTDPPEEWVIKSKTVVNVRNGPAKEYDRVRQCKNGDKVYVYEIKDVRGVPWGRLEDGWICLSYAKKSE